MLKRLTAAFTAFALTCAMGAMFSFSVVTPAFALKSGQGVLACAANLKCNDFVTDDGEHVMCVKGGGCVLCPKDPQSNCIMAMRLHTGKITTDPGQVLMDGTSSQTTPSTSGAVGGSGKGNGIILY